VIFVKLYHYPDTKWMARILDQKVQGLVAPRADRDCLAGNTPLAESSDLVSAHVFNPV